MKRLVLIATLLLPLTGCQCSCTVESQSKKIYSDFMDGDQEGVVLVTFASPAAGDERRLIRLRRTATQKFVNCRTTDSRPKVDEYWKIRLAEGQIEFVEFVSGPKETK